MGRTPSTTRAALGTAILALLAATGCGLSRRTGGDGDGKTSGPVLQSISITPALVSVAVGDPIVLVCLGDYGSGNLLEVEADWTVSSGPVALSAATGGSVTVQGSAQGTGIVQAHVGGLGAQANLTVL